MAKKVDYEKQFKKCKGDADRWKWIQSNQGKGLVVLLDNDETYIDNTNDEDSEMMVFDSFIGRAPGITALLYAMDIDSDYI